MECKDASCIDPSCGEAAGKEERCHGDKEVMLTPSEDKNSPTPTLKDQGDVKNELINKPIWSYGAMGTTPIISENAGTKASLTAKDSDETSGKCCIILCLMLCFSLLGAVMLVITLVSVAAVLLFYLLAGDNTQVFDIGGRRRLGEDMQFLYLFIPVTACCYILTIITISRFSMAATPKNAAVPERKRCGLLLRVCTLAFYMAVSIVFGPLLLLCDLMVHHEKTKKWKCVRWIVFFSSIVFNNNLLNVMVATSTHHEYHQVSTSLN